MGNRLILLHFHSESVIADTSRISKRFYHCAFEAPTLFFEASNVTKEQRLNYKGKQSIMLNVVLAHRPCMKVMMKIKQQPHC